MQGAKRANSKKWVEPKEPTPWIESESHRYWKNAVFPSRDQEHPIRLRSHGKKLTEDAVKDTYRMFLSISVSYEHHTWSVQTVLQPHAKPVKCREISIWGNWWFVFIFSWYLVFLVQSSPNTPRVNIFTLSFYCKNTRRHDRSVANCLVIKRHFSSLHLSATISCREKWGLYLRRYQ